MATLTVANAIIMLGVTGLYDNAQQIQGFAADDVFSVDEVEPTETLMGVDGRLSGGFVCVPVTVDFMLQADSPSIAFFDGWYDASQALRETLIGFGIIRLSSLGYSYSINRMFLNKYKRLPDAKKIFQPRKFTLVCESMTRAPIL